MGQQMAVELANDFSLTLEQAIEIHLTSNHYPPVPPIMVGVCVEAIQLANEGYWLAEVELPEGVTYKGQAKAEVSEIVDGLHLEAWIDYEDYDID
jgi:hypothetical protein